MRMRGVIGAFVEIHAPLLIVYIAERTDVFLQQNEGDEKLHAPLGGCHDFRFNLRGQGVVDGYLSRSPRSS
jgi:hypothetical protein